MRILGIDFGQKKIGLAITEGLLSEPLGIIKIANYQLQIANICREKEIEKLVVGVSEGRMAEKQRQFGEKLARMTNLPVDFQDETLTTKEALAKMKEIGKRIEDEDAVAAALILEAYLERQKSV